MKRCPICGVEFHPRSNRQKYCGDECATIVERENSRIRNQKFRDKQPYGHKNRKKKGRGSLGSTPDPIVEHEMMKVMKEMERLGLKSVIKNAGFNPNA